MAEKRNYWLKLQEGYFAEQKIKDIRSLAGGDTLLVIYLKMQLLTLKNNGVYRLSSARDSLEEEIAAMINETVASVHKTLAYLERQNLIVVSESRELTMLEVVGNTGSESASAERVRRSRANNKNSPKALQCNANTPTEEIIAPAPSPLPPPTRKPFTKPTVGEIQEYVDEIKANISAQTFWDFYESKGWVVGKSPMKSWRAAVRTWMRREKDSSKKGAKKLIGGREIERSTYTDSDLNSLFTDLGDNEGK